MLIDPVLFFAGSCTLRVAAQHRTALLDICLQEGINYREFVCEDDGAVRFRVAFSASRRLRKRCAEQGIAVELLERRGVPYLLYLYRRRAGLITGVLLAVVLCVLSSRFVWHVRVTGNVEMTEQQVLSQLRECGFGVGSYIPALELAKLENRLLLTSDRIGWVSIYIDGTVARVQIIEYTEAPPPEDLSRPANLVAAYDGQIETVELFRGNCVVKRGQAVKKGELLVSGLYDSDLYGYRWTRASGKVFARTEHTFTVEIPLDYTQKRVQEPIRSEIVLNFFNFSLKIFKNTGNLPPMYDIIEEERSPRVWGDHPLPLSLRVTSVAAYSEETCRRTPEEALALAYDALDEEMLSLAERAQLLRKEITTRLTEDALILDCTVFCIEDIALQSEFEITDQP